MDVITTHINADFDCLGAMIAAHKLYPDAEMVFAGAQERSLREFFVKSAVYAFDFKRIRDIDLDAIDRLILVDVRQASRIGPFGDVARRPGVTVHIYDHHPEGQADVRGELERIEPVGATVTVLTHLFMEKGIEPDAEEATMMMLGLYEDTGGLLFNSTTVRDFEAAGFLLKHGANLDTVAEFLTQEMTPDQVALLHELIKSRTVLNVNGIDISIAHASLERFVGDLAVLAHKLKDMENLNALVVAVQMGDRIFLVGRSRVPEVHVGEILGEFGGGGHSFAASGTVRDLTLVQVLDRLPIILARHVNPRWQARHLMSSPVKSAKRNATIGEVRHILTRYNINALPVTDGESVVGIVTRQIVERAAHHGLSKVAVSEYMNGEFSVVAPNASMEELQELIVGHNQRFVPVVEAGELVGVVTRADLLRHMVSGSRPAYRAAVEDGGVTIKKRQLARLARAQLPNEIQQLLREMGEVGQNMGTSVFVVGGFVRDLLLRKENLDVDVVVEGDGIAFAKAFAKDRRCRVRAHRKFGTAVIIFPDGFKVDVASTRLEYYIEPGALPTVEHASIKLDLYRRDFTINTLAMNLNPDSYGELLDFFSAQRDLKEKAIRVLHNLSFVEDPTRVFRAVRFEQRLGFRMGKHTEHLLNSAVRMGFLEKVGGTRVFNELVIILKEHDPLPAIFRLASLDLLKFIHPALAPGDETRRCFTEAGRAIHWYELLYTGERCCRWQVYLLALTADLDRDAMKGVVQRLNIPNRYREIVLDQRFAAHRTLDRLERRHGKKQPLRPSELHHSLSPFATEVLLYLMARTKEDEVRSWLSRFVTKLRGVECLLNGNDLKALGIPPGPLYKKILIALTEARLNEKVTTREEEIAFVRKRFLC